MRIPLLSLFLLLAIVLPAHSESRPWTAPDGRTHEGEMVGFENATVKIRRADGRVFPIPLDKPSRLRRRGQSKSESPP